MSIEEETTQEKEPLVCELCYPDLVVYGEVMPGWVLAYQAEAHRHLPAAHYALFDHFHSPLFWWPHKPIESTMERDGDEIADAWPDDHPDAIQEDLFIATVLAMEPHFDCQPQTGYALVEACLKAGWQRQNSGMPLFWLANRMALLIAAHQASANPIPGSEIP